jgi:hypothetical protein
MPENQPLTIGNAPQMRIRSQIYTAFGSWGVEAASESPG